MSGTHRWQKSASDCCMCAGECCVCMWMLYVYKWMSYVYVLCVHVNVLCVQVTQRQHQRMLNMLHPRGKPAPGSVKPSRGRQSHHTVIPSFSRWACFTWKCQFLKFFFSDFFSGLCLYEYFFLSYSILSWQMWAVRKSWHYWVFPHPVLNSKHRCAN